MENVVEILHVLRKGKMMNTLDRFHICIETKLDNRGETPDAAKS
jgi:hypothetical protein